MGAPYTSVAVSGYNSNPPADDGSAVSTNQIKWSTAKTKLGDPLNTAVASINSNVSTAFGKMLGGASVNSQGVSYAIISTDQGKLIRATASGITLTFPDATAVGSPFTFAMQNSSSGNITLAGASAQTINGSTSLAMGAGDGYTAFTDGSNWFVTGRKTGVLPRGYIDGCILANASGDATNDITIAAGVCRDSTNTVDITVAAMATGKQLDANWAPGDAAGMRNSAAGIANAVYHIYAVAKADGTQDIYAHTSTTVATVITALQAETGGASYIYARCIGSISRLSAAIILFTQNGDFFRIKTPIHQADNALSTSVVTYALTTQGVPTGFNMLVKMNASVVSAGGARVYIKALADTDLAPSAGSAAPEGSLGEGSSSLTTTGQVDVWVDTSAQFSARALAASTGFAFAPLWYRHPRGKDS